MAKKRRKAAKKTKKKLTRLQIFFLGVATGLGLFWVPMDHEFSPVHFTQNEWPKQNTLSIFSQYLPTTTPLIQREGYVLAYDGRTRNPHWVYHKLTPEVLNKQVSREDCDFKEDPLIPKHIRATKNDYSGAGFDRGHLFPAGDSLNSTVMEESFFLSNITPQTPAFNRGYWKKLENHIRDLTKEYQMVHVFAGPLYLSHKNRDQKRYVQYQVIGSQNVAVPTHFFALIFVELPTKKIMGKGYILPNKSIDPKTSLKKFSASIEEVESASGVVFTQILD